MLCFLILAPSTIWCSPVLSQDRDLSEGRDDVRPEWWYHHRRAQCTACSMCYVNICYSNVPDTSAISSSKNSEIAFILCKKRMTYELDVMWELHKI